MDEINELIEAIIIDVAEEGIGSSVGMGLIWGMFFGGTFTAFSGIISLLVSTI